MKILQINKFLHPVGGAESYMFELSEALKDLGHEVKFWGMQHKDNLVEDEFNCFTKHINYQKVSRVQKILFSLRTIYSFQNKKNIEKLLKHWKPEVVHIHNYNFQLTPAILEVFYAHNIKVIQTIHDSQMVCPYHRLYNFQKENTCIKCVEGSFINCIKDKCFDGSIVKSSIGAIESMLYHHLNYYDRYINQYISPSNFLKNLISKRVSKPIKVLHNFSGIYNTNNVLKDNSDSYYLYYGRISKEKGILDILPAIKKLNIRLIIIGSGPDSQLIHETDKISYLGPKYGEELIHYISNAKFVIQPSIWFENCPMTIVESFSLGTPVIGANHSGFKELINHNQNGFLINFSQQTEIEKQLINIDQMYTVKLRENSRAFYNKYLSKEFHVNEVVNTYKLALKDEK